MGIMPLSFNCSFKLFCLILKLIVSCFDQQLHIVCLPTNVSDEDYRSVAVLVSDLLKLFLYRKRVADRILILPENRHVQQYLALSLKVHVTVARTVDMQQHVLVPLVSRL